MLVQEVMAAITTSPWPMSKFLPSTCTRLACSPGLAKPALSLGESRADWKPCLMSCSGTNFSGRLGPAMAGTTAPRSSSSVSVNTGSGDVLVQEHALCLGVFLDERDAIVLAAGELEIVERHGVDGEEAAGGAIFRCHVGDRRAVGQRQTRKAGAEEFHELVDHALLAQHLRDQQHEVGRGHAFLQLAHELEADHLGQQHGLRLAQHRGFRLDAAHAPAQHAKAIHHGGVAVGADERIGIGHDDLGLRLALGHGLGAGPDGLGEILEIHLMADAGVRRHHAEILEGALPPFEELVALPVLLVLALHVGRERLGVAEVVDHHGVVDHQIHRHQRIDLLGIAAQQLHAVAHGGEIDHGGNAGEILHQHARRAEAHLGIGLALVVEPGHEALDVGLRHRAAILVAQEVLEQHLQRIGQPGNAGEAVLLRGLEAEVGIGLGADLEGLAALETVEGHRGLFVVWDCRSL